MLVEDECQITIYITWDKESSSQAIYPSVGIFN